MWYKQPTSCKNTNLCILCIFKPFALHSLFLDSEKRESTQKCTKRPFPLWAICFASIQAAIIVILSIIFAILLKLDCWKPEPQDSNDNERQSTSNSSGYWLNKPFDPVIITNEKETKYFVENRRKGSLTYNGLPSPLPTSRSVPPIGSSSSILGDVSSKRNTALGGTRSSSIDSQITIIRDLGDSTDAVKKVLSPGIQTNAKNAEGVYGLRFSLKSDPKK